MANHVYFYIHFNEVDKDKVFKIDNHRGWKEPVEAYQQPFMANVESLTGTGQLPKFEEDLFKVLINYF